MTHHPEFTEEVKKVNERNGAVVLTDANGRVGLVALFRKLHPGKTEAQGLTAVTKAICKYRVKLRRGTVERPVGGPTARAKVEVDKSNAKNNPKNNAKNNPKNSAKNNAKTNAKTKLLLKEENLARIAGDPELAVHLMSDEDVAEVTRDLLDEIHAELDGMTLRAAVASGKWAIYIGLTKRRLRDEALRFLTQRGDINEGCLNCPVLRLANGNVINYNKAVKDLRVKHKFIFNTKLKANSSRVEEGLQLAINHFPLGQKLHRVAGAGSGFKDPDEKTNPDYLSKVFFTAFKVTGRRYRTGRRAPTHICVEGEWLPVVV